MWPVNETVRKGLVLFALLWKEEMDEILESLNIRAKSKDKMAYACLHPSL